MVAFPGEMTRNKEQDAPLSEPMRYFLNVRADCSLLVDEAGNDFPDHNAACAYAMRIALELAREYPRRTASQPAAKPLALEVLDHAGTLVFRAPVR